MLTEVKELQLGLSDMIVVVDLREPSLSMTVLVISSGTRVPSFNLFDRMRLIILRELDLRLYSTAGVYDTSLASGRGLL